MLLLVVGLVALGAALLPFATPDVARHWERDFAPSAVPAALPIAELMRRRAHLPLVNPAELRSDLDAVIDASL